MNTSARRQILIRNGGALEHLSDVTAVVLDKTGTITIGRPNVSRILSFESIPELELLGLAGAVEQGSGHLLARTLVQAAKEAGAATLVASDVVETPGRGVEGTVNGSRVAIGARSFISERYPAAVAGISAVDDSSDQQALRAYVAIDGTLEGVIEYADRVRDGIATLVASLREFGVRHVLLLSGDRSENTRAIAREVGIDEWRGDMLPEDKVEVVNHLIANAETVVMMGDGTNDAPALSAASVGIALASHGRGIATEAADVILLADDPSRLIDAIRISRRTMRIARQSIWAGLSVSVIGMVFAAAGQIAPLAGAGIQELVDMGVILNALRASRALPMEKSDKSRRVRIANQPVTQGEGSPSPGLMT
jgi:P-type E1-E2 ATPase